MLPNLYCLKLLDAVLQWLYSSKPLFGLAGGCSLPDTVAADTDADTNAVEADADTVAADTVAVETDAVAAGTVAVAVAADTDAVAPSASPA